MAGWSRPCVWRKSLSQEEQHNTEARSLGACQQWLCGEEIEMADEKGGNLGTETVNASWASSQCFAAWMGGQAKQCQSAAAGEERI